MKASQILSASPLLLLLLLGGCLEPIPFDTPNYPQGSGSLRYPPGNQQQAAPRVNSNPSNTNRWNRTTPGTYPNEQRYNDERAATKPAPKPKPRPTPKPTPKPKPPEDAPLVDIDPIEEAAKPKYDYALPVQGATNLVVSPYAKEGPYIDVSNLTSGTQIECPKTGKTILVP